MSEIKNGSIRIKEILKAEALRLGFCLCGVTSNEPLQEFNRYENWLQANLHGDMQYLASERHHTLRQNPEWLVSWVKSIIVLAWPYLLNRSSTNSVSGQIAGYVGKEDYHAALPQKIQPITDLLHDLIGDSLQAQVFTDSSPILERELAVRAGLGWIGRNSCLISPKFGSSFLLAEVFVNFEILPDPPFEREHCGNCQRCIEACPTGCILPDHTLDARKCISTLTIENKSAIPFDLRKPIANRVFGCDICQTVCPWNHETAPITEDFSTLTVNKMLEILSLLPEQFNQRFNGSALLRPKRRGLVRNCCIVLGNLHIEEAWSQLAKMLTNDPDPVCRAAAAWALKQLSSEKAATVILNAVSRETDIQVLAEFQKLLK